MKKILISLLLSIACLNLFGQQEAKWLRNPSISPDGKEIIFGYMGNLYKVSSTGGTAVPITTGSDYCTRAIWSHDGSTIAFSSNKHGNFDIFTMPAKGGIPVRVTYNSRNDIPFDFTPDNKNILFSSARFQPAQSVRMPVAGFSNLYSIPADGGRPILLTAVGATEARYNGDGSKIIYQDWKGYEDDYRKHHTSAVTRDIWIYDIAAGQYTQLSDFKGENRSPAFSADNQYFFYTNEKDGTLNLYKRNIASSDETQLTSFKNFPVREVSVSGDNTLSFVWKGDIYTLKEGQQPIKLNISIATDAGYDMIKNLNINSLTEFEARPGGKEMAIVNRGEVFVVGIEDSRTKRITDTPYQERMISWSKDGKYLYFSAEKNGTWGIYRTSLQNEDEKYFYLSTILKTESVIADSTNNYQPVCSPDNKKIAYIHERNELRVYDLATKESVTVLPFGINYSYADGDWSFTWSPDSKWLLVDSQKGCVFQTNTAFIKADGTGEMLYPVNSGFGDYNAKFALEGKAMLYQSSRDGLKAPSTQGEQENDIYAVFFDKKEYDRFNLSKEDLAILKEKEDAEKSKKDSLDKVAAEKVKKSKSKKDKKDDKKEEVKLLTFDFNNIENRRVRLTINSGKIGGYAMTKDGSKLFYVREELQGWRLWKTEPRSGETKPLATLSSSTSLELSSDESKLFLINGGSPASVDVESGDMKPIAINGKMALNSAAEREYIFNHIWNQVERKFYDPNIHGIDWKMYRDEYAEFLPYIDNNFDFQVLLSEMLGELNASHTGARYYSGNSGGDITASLGMLFDEQYSGPGIKVSEVVPGGIADRENNKIKAGDIITAINSMEIKADDNYNKYLNNIAEQQILLSVKSGDKTFTQVMRPDAGRGMGSLLYDEWTKKMEKMVDSLSGGRLGYVHVQGMNESSYRTVIDKVLGKNLEKEAIVVDTRFNGGGWLHDDLNTFLSGKAYLKFAPQGADTKGVEPFSRWNKPSIVLICEGNYSDAFIFPFIYQQNGLGKLVGMPVAGTGTAVWWESQIDNSIVFGIPMIGTIGLNGKVTENQQLEPDIQVSLPYSETIKGRDAQIEAAVKELLKELDSKK
jgi:tricorn protease